MNAVNVIVGAIVLFVAFSLLFAVPVMWLWDWLMPQLFGLKEVTLFQAWGLSMLSSLLFKSHSSK